MGAPKVDIQRLPTAMGMAAGMYLPGDYVCPSYTSEGRKTVRGEVQGHSEEVNKMVEAITRSALKRGELMDEIEEPQPVKSTKAKAKKAKSASKVKVPVKKSSIKVKPTLKVDVHSNHEEKVKSASPRIEDYESSRPKDVYRQVDEPSIDIVFVTEFGNITVTALAVMDEPSAVAIVFKNAKDMRFTPKPGTWVEIQSGGKTFETYYPGVTFTSYVDSEAKIMLLFKKDQDEIKSKSGAGNDSDVVE